MSPHDHFKDDAADFTPKAVPDGEHFPPVDEADAIPFGEDRELDEAEVEPIGLVPVDWEAVQAEGVPEPEYVIEPYLPRRKRIWAVGPAESGRSIWAAHQAAVATRSGLVVVYISQENGLEEEVRRFLRLKPKFSNLHLYVDQGLDLTIGAHQLALFDVVDGASLLVLDTLTACWSGDEDSNTEVAGFDRDVLVPIRDMGASPVVLDHTGNPQAFVKRQGVSAPRGASAKGQKADFLLVFQAGGDTEFSIHHGKARGTRKQTPRAFRVVDTDGDGLDIIEVETSIEVRAQQVADEIVETWDAEFLTTGKLRDRMKALGAGVDLQNEAMVLLGAEDPPRLVAARETVDTGGGRQSAKVWRALEGESSRGLAGGSEGSETPPDGERQGGSERRGLLRAPCEPPLEAPSSLQIEVVQVPQDADTPEQDEEVERLADLARSMQESEQ